VPDYRSVVLVIDEFRYAFHQSLLSYLLFARKTYPSAADFVNKPVFFAFDAFGDGYFH